MPILISCPSCGAKSKAPDQLAGKKAKCPKCGKGVPVPGSAAPAASKPPTPSAKSPAPAAAAAAPKPQPKASPASAVELPLQTFDELKISGRFRARIEKEIGPGKIVWMGRPNPEEKMRQARLGPIFGIIFILLTPAAFLLLLLELEPDKQWIMTLSAIGLASMLFFFFGLPMLFMPLLVRMFINFRSVYVLTNTRAIVAHNRFGIFAAVWSYGREELEAMEIEEGEGGLGSIVMGYEEYRHQGRLVHKTKEYKDQQGNVVKKVSTLKRKGGHTSKIPVGFLDVDDVLKVESLIRRTLKLPARMDAN